MEIFTKFHFPYFNISLLNVSMYKNSLHEGFEK